MFSGQFYEKWMLVRESNITLPLEAVTCKKQHPQYLFHLIPMRHSSHTSRNVHSIPFLSIKHSFFKNTFFPSTIYEWNKLDPAIHNSESLSIIETVTFITAKKKKRSTNIKCSRKYHQHNCNRTSKPA